MRATPDSQIFLLSPAHSGGERASLLLRPQAKFELAHRVQSPQGAPLGEVFSFASGLYFRGKLLYAETFAKPPKKVPGVLVITPGSGLCEPSMPVTASKLKEWGRVPVDVENDEYRLPLVRDADVVARSVSSKTRIVLLGSVASGKYVDILTAIFGTRLLFPDSFVGRGDMSRGGLLLRSAREKSELSYVPVLGAIRRGSRPPKLPRLPKVASAR